MSDEIKNPNTEEENQPDLMTLEDEDGNEIKASIWTSWMTTNCCWSWASCLKSA